MDKKKVAVVFQQSQVPFAEGKTIGVYKDDQDKIWFHGPDVARLLDYRPQDMYRMIDNENKGAHIVHGVNHGASQSCVSLSEAGFYQVALSSRTELGRKLMTFVCNELLPTIRKTGAYLSDSLTPEQVKRVVENQIVDKCIRASRGERVVIGNLVKAILENNTIDSIRKDIFPYILKKLADSRVHRVKEVFFDRASETIAAWGDQKFLESKGKVDVYNHIGLLYLLKETEESKSNFLSASRSQTVRRLVNSKKK